MYKATLECKGHSVSLVENGEECLKLYNSRFHGLNKNRKVITSPFDVTILDYKMPKKDGMEVAKQILEWNPNQRIIFASAFVLDTLLDSVKYLTRPVELIQKPFNVEVLVDMIEDKEIFDSVKSISKVAKKIKNIDNPSQREIRELLKIFAKAQKNKGLIIKSDLQEN
jgi:CheY-like chemotaxis protein